MRGAEFQRDISSFFCNLPYVAEMTAAVFFDELATLRDSSRPSNIRKEEKQSQESDSADATQNHNNRG